eukprot:TRINITY_DN2016_c0_g1_i1.p1 TRINITY_DN2016_c0_g1~~TRINITY_DN2016_c0_g1_i1.p1  ORF type:complete len:124 (-),score=11.18 TRINITY_DN2016_c0_g1_i1:748-1119(-)
MVWKLSCCRATLYLVHEHTYAFVRTGEKRHNRLECPSTLRSVFSEAPSFGKEETDPNIIHIFISVINKLDPNSEVTKKSFRLSHAVSMFFSPNFCLRYQNQYSSSSCATSNRIAPITIPGLLN